MSDSDDFDDLPDEDSADSTGPKALRDHVRKLQKELAESKKTQEALTGRIAESTVKEVLTGRGVDATKVARLTKYMKADEVDLMDGPAIAAWLGENAEDFGINLAPAESDEERADMRNQLERQSQSTGPGVVPNAQQSLIDQMREITDNKELARFVEAHKII